MKDENLNINNSQINNNINDTSTNQSSSYEMESFGIENPLLFSDYKRKDSTDVLKLKLTEEENNKKIVYPSNILSSLCFGWVYDVVKQSKKNKDLKFSYLGEVSDNFKSENIYKEIESKWYGKYYYLLQKLKELKKRSIYPLLMTLIKANYWRIIFSLVLSLRYIRV